MAETFLNYSGVHGLSIPLRQISKQLKNVCFKPPLHFIWASARIDKDNTADAILQLWPKQDYIYQSRFTIKYRLTNIKWSCEQNEFNQKANFSV